jgi:hypothetical protein
VPVARRALVSIVSSIAGSIVVVVIPVGCGGGGSSNAPTTDTGVEIGDDAAPVGCAAGEAQASDGHCEPAGIPPTSCAAGFVATDDRACDAVLPNDPCPAGQLAIPGESACHDVAPCADGTWGDIPVDATTQYVDASYAGTAPSDGSTSAPWKTIHEAVTAASSGAIVAVAAGTYAESVLIKKPVRVWGRCPSKVAIDIPSGAGAFDVRAGASGAEIHGIAMHGDGIGVLLSGSKDVIVDHVWVHDTTDHGVNLQRDFGDSSLTFTHSLIDRATEAAVFSAGCAVTVESSVVRATLPLSDHTSGRGVDVEFDHGVRATLVVRSSVVERNHEFGVFVKSSDATIESTVVRDTQPQVKDNQYGIGIDLFTNDAALRASLTMRTSIVERNRSIGVYVGGSDATIETTVVRDTQPEATTDAAGYGMQVAVEQGQRPTLSIASSVFERNVEFGMLLDGTDATITSSIVRDTALDAQVGAFGRGIHAQRDPFTYERSNLTLRSSLISGSYDVGVMIVSSDLVADGLWVRDSLASPKDSLYGDGIAVFAEKDVASGTITDSRIEHSDRAGIASFGAALSIATTTLECNGLHLDAEPFSSWSYTFTDGGGDVCGCSGAVVTCQILNAGLAPPSSPTT